jgi:hypothetical protein
MLRPLKEQWKFLAAIKEGCIFATPVKKREVLKKAGKTVL